MRIRKLIQTTVAPATHDELKKRSKAAEIPLGVLLDDAWQFYVGNPSPLAKARRTMVFTDAPVKRAA